VGLINTATSYLVGADSILDTELGYSDSLRVPPPPSLRENVALLLGYRPQIIPFQNLKYTSLPSCLIRLYVSHVSHIFKGTCTWPVQANLHLHVVTRLISQ
jgi:hypothetical protein